MTSEERRRIEREIDRYMPTFRALASYDRGEKRP